LAEDAPRSPDAAPIDFSTAVHDHWNGVFRLICTLGGDPHEAEDLTQETFLRAMSNASGFTPGSNLRAWLLRIATNAFFDERRKRKRAKRRELSPDLPATGVAPGEAMETAEQAALARAAMEELTELTRLVFHLRVTEGLSFREIAELAGTTEQAARWHMHQARMKLLARLDKQPPAGEKK
jgi:RNA polymerase sigma-70 factor (ECF subfamily)